MKRRRKPLPRAYHCELCGKRSRDCKHGEKWVAFDDLERYWLRKSYLLGVAAGRRERDAVLAVLGGPDIQAL